MLCHYHNDGGNKILDELLVEYFAVRRLMRYEGERHRQVALVSRLFS